MQRGNFISLHPPFSKKLLFSLFPAHPFELRVEQVEARSGIAREAKPNIKPKTKESLLTDISPEKWGKNSLADQ